MALVVPVFLRSAQFSGDVKFGDLQLEKSAGTFAPELSEIVPGEYCLATAETGCFTYTHLNSTDIHGGTFSVYVDEILEDLSFSKSKEFTVTIEKPIQGARPSLKGPVLKKTKESLAKQAAEEEEKNKSFFQKYWMYIVPVAILLMFGGGGGDS